MDRGKYNLVYHLCENSCIMFYVTIQKAVFREVFWGKVVHRKPENNGVKS